MEATNRRRTRLGRGAGAAVGILCPGGPCGWAVTGAIFGLCAILHQSRPIQAGPSVEDRYSGTQHPRRAVPLTGRSVVHCGGHA